MVQLGGTLVVAAALVLVLVWGRPRAIERRGRNAWVGIRIPSTLASDEAWVAGHRAAWPATRLGCATGVVLVLASGVLVLLGDLDVSGAVMIAGLLVVLAAVLVGARAADRAARAVARHART